MPSTAFSPSPVVHRHRSWLWGGVLLLLLLIGGGAAVVLNEHPQDLRQQAKMANLEGNPLADETTAIKTAAQTQGIAISDTEASALSQRITRIKGGAAAKTNINKLGAAREDQSSVTAATANPTWEVGLTSFALQKLRNPNYSKYTDATSEVAAFTKAAAAHKPIGNLNSAPSAHSTIMGTTALGTALGSQLNTNATLPLSYDWRSAQGANFMTPVKNQASCGSCWAFSGNATLETAVAAYYNQPNKQLDLSEQNLLSCSTNTNGCVGTVDLTKDYNQYVLAHGVVTESCMAYRQCDQNVASCRCPSGDNRCNGNAPAAVYSGTYSTVPVVWADQDREIVDAYATANNIKRAIIEHGAISTGIFVYNDFELYVNGIYQRTSTSTYQGGHVITLVGWGQENGQPYWLFKNSWSTQWGQNGYGKYKMFGAHPGDTIDLLAVSSRYTQTGGPDFGIEGLAGLYGYVGHPLLSYIDTPKLQGDTISRSCTDRDHDGYCFWGFGSGKPATGCPASCAAHTQADCDDGRNTIGGNCAAITPPANPTPTHQPSPTATRTPTRIPTPTAKPTTKLTPTPTPMHCGGNVRNPQKCPAGYTCHLSPTNPDAGGTCKPAAPTATPTPKPPAKPTPTPTPMHCGGNIRNPKQCPAGYVCRLSPTNPDAGGTCKPVAPTATPIPSAHPTGAPIAAADIDQNKVVNSADITILLANYGRSPLINPRADVNHDGVVNAIDYVFVLDFLNQTIH